PPRRSLHGRIVQAIERLHEDHSAGEVERLAQHAVRGELWEQAAFYLRQPGTKAAARSALPDARGWFEQALEALARMPESPSTLTEGLEIRLDLWVVLNQLGEVRQALERLRVAEVLADRLNDDRQRGRVCATVTNLHSLLGELDEALATGERALEITDGLGDLRLRILSTTYLEQVHYFRGDYQRVVELATDNLAVLPAAVDPAPLGSARAPAGQGSLLARPEPHPAREIHGGLGARRRGDPARRADAARDAPGTGPPCLRHHASHPV